MYKQWDTRSSQRSVLMPPHPLSQSPLLAEESSRQPWLLTISLFQAVLVFKIDMVQLYFLTLFL